VKRARYYWLLRTESHLTRRLFGAMLRLIELLAVARRIDEPAIERISPGTQEGEARVREEWPQRGQLKRWGDAQPTQGSECSEAPQTPNRLGGCIPRGQVVRYRPGPELVLEIPVEEDSCARSCFAASR
jgi:hypothetical protein